MTILDKNLEKLQEVRSELYEGLVNLSSTDDILIGDALDGEKFIALLKEKEVLPLNSTYHPSHESERFVAQFEGSPMDTTLFLFGFGNGLIVEQALYHEDSIQTCMVYEPSATLFRKVLEEYDITKLIEDDRLLILIDGINGEKLEKVLYTEMNYRNWKLFQFKSLYRYEELFNEKYKEVKSLYENVISDKKAEMNTLITFAKSGMKNEIKSLKWMMNCRALDQYKGKFPKELPCIVVAAGPSLEKNIEELRRSKGKAFIICVDTALKFLLERDILPDMTCTVDPQKGESYFVREEIKEIPIAISTDSDYRSLEQIGNIKPVYISITNDFQQRLFHSKQIDIGYFDGGGSVGTVCFQIAVELGFQTIVIVGQDLAFSDDKAHAGMGTIKQSDLFYNLVKVDGYYGEKVLTRGDFKHYIDWYNLRIPELSDRKIINATEGGAKLKGAIQMPLREAVDKYCIQTCQLEEVLESVSPIWHTKQEREQLYFEFKDKYRYFQGLQRRLKEGIGYTERAIFLLKQGNYQQKELQEIDKKLDRITREISDKEGIVILVKRMIDTDVTLTDDLHITEDDLELESIRLYEKMKKYISDMSDAISELLPEWQGVMNEINNVYQFE